MFRASRAHLQDIDVYKQHMVPSLSIRVLVACRYAASALSLSRAHARTHARTHARARARTHTHTHTCIFTSHCSSLFIVWTQQI